MLREPTRIEVIYVLRLTCVFQENSLSWGDNLEYISGANIALAPTYLAGVQEDNEATNNTLEISKIYAHKTWQRHDVAESP